MNKLILAALLVSAVSLSYADQGADSFGTGFANALQQALIARQQAQNQAQASQQPQQEYRPISGHYDARTNYGTMGGMNFATYDQCMRFVDNSFTYRECIWVGQ